MRVLEFAPDVASRERLKEILLSEVNICLKKITVLHQQQQQLSKTYSSIEGMNADSQIGMTPNLFQDPSSISPRNLNYLTIPTNPTSDFFSNQNQIIRNPFTPTPQNKAQSTALHTGNSLRHVASSDSWPDSAYYSASHLPRCGIPDCPGCEHCIDMRESWLQLSPIGGEKGNSCPSTTELEGLLGLRSSESKDLGS